MAKRAARREKTTIDPMFYIPEGVDELEYADDNFEYTSEALEEGEFDDDTDYADRVDTPQIYGIIPPQIIRMDESGKEVVDVVFDVEEIKGATDYEFRVTKR